MNFINSLTYHIEGTDESITVNRSDGMVLLSLRNFAKLLDVKEPSIMSTFEDLVNRGILDPSSRSSVEHHVFREEALEPVSNYSFDQDSILAIGFTLNPKRLISFRRWLDERLIESIGRPIDELHSLFRDAIGRPKLNLAYVAFVDLLGYKKQIELSTNESVGTLLGTLCEALATAADRMGHEDIDMLTTQVRYFSDCVSMITPITPRHDPWCESEFGSTINPLNRWQLSMVLDGLFVRGGIAFGPIYTDRHSIFGRAHLKAYELEQNEAKFPRIILCPDTVKLVYNQLGTYSPEFFAPHQSELLVDTDGKIFLNYLSALWDAPGLFPSDAIQVHQNVITKALSDNSNPLIKEKYEWVARYHDWFCTLPENEDFGYRRYTIGEEVVKYADLRTTLEAEFSEEG